MFVCVYTWTNKNHFRSIENKISNQTDAICRKLILNLFLISCENFRISNIQWNDIVSIWSMLIELDTLSSNWKMVLMSIFFFSSILSKRNALQIENRKTKCLLYATHRHSMWTFLMRERRKKNSLKINEDEPSSN